MSLTSASAFAERTTPFLGADIGVGLLAAAIPLPNVPSDLGHQLGGVCDTLAPIELVKTDLQLRPQLLELTLLLVQQAHRLADDFAGVGELTGFDLLPDSGFHVGGYLDRHRIAPLPC